MNVSRLRPSVRVRAGGAMLALLLPLVAGTAARAQGGGEPRLIADSVRWNLVGGLRVRGERWDWFDETPGGRYWLVGALARLGIERQGARLGWRVEMAAPALLHLPDDAVAPAPAGALGLGGTYWAANFRADNAAQLFPKQAYLRLTRRALSVTNAIRVGRFEYDDGTETTPANATLAEVKRARVSQRLLGTFGWSHVGRSLDGVQLSQKKSGRDATLIVAAPTRGVFQADGWGPLPIAVAYGAWTVPYSAHRGDVDARIFGLQYSDFREDRVQRAKPDNRDVTVVPRDAKKVNVTTLGAHWLYAATGRPGTVDVVLWGALQYGAWGTLSHRAWAGVTELGLSPAALPAARPSLRVGVAHGSGDDDPRDETHGTFFQVLPTPRPYARFPFYDMMNTTDAYAILALRPSPRLTLRGEAHGIRLASARDLWYQGGGAYQTRSFGYTGRPTSGSGDLSRLLDFSADLRITPDFTLTGYVGKARAGEAMRTAYPVKGPGILGYVEVNRTF